MVVIGCDIFLVSSFNQKLMSPWPPYFGNSSRTLLNSNALNQNSTYLLRLLQMPTLFLVSKSYFKNNLSSLIINILSDKQLFYWIYKSSEILPFVSGCIQDVAQLIFKGQPSKTLEKQAPILIIKKKN